MSTADEARVEDGAAMQLPDVQAVERDAATMATPPLDVQAVEKILGYQFHRRELVEEALTHASFYYYQVEPAQVAGKSYARLEFIGDAVLNLIMAWELFTGYPELSPGPLTKLRSANVDTEKLARAAVGNGLHRFLIHKAPYLDGQIQDFMKAILDYPIHSNGLLDPPKVLADIVEALIGAIYVDSNGDIKAVWKVFKGLSQPLIHPETLGKHPMTELYELCQKERMALSILKDRWMESMAVEVLVNGELVGRATYGQKKEVALNRAAKAALDHLKLMLANHGSLGGLTQSMEPQRLQDKVVQHEEVSILEHTCSSESDN